MLTINLQENKTSGPFCLSLEQVDELIQVTDELGIQLDIERVTGSENEYRLTPGSTIGAFETANYSVFIKPKIAIKQLVSILCYTIGHVRFQEDEFRFPEETALPDALALAFRMAAWKCFARGLCHGYQIHEEELYTVRGRIRFDEQVSQGNIVSLPIGVRYDEFTEDILLNRLVKAAAWRLHCMSLKSKTSLQLSQLMSMLRSVEYVEFAPNAVPNVKFNHLNEHYRSVVTLAQIILRHGAFEASRGNVRAAGFVVDMARVFQEFVTTALKYSLKVTGYEKFGEHHINSLDLKNSVKLRPDLTWWGNRKCLFVGDVKYKTIGDVEYKTKSPPNSDLYQLLAYATALDLPGGILIYAGGETDIVTYKIRHSGKHLVIATLDLSSNLDQVLSKVDKIASQVKGLYDIAKGIASYRMGLEVNTGI